MLYPADTTGQSYWAVIRSLESFPGLAMCMMVASLQEGGNSPVSQIFKKKLKGTGEKVQEDALKSGNVIGSGLERGLQEKLEVCTFKR